MPPITLKLFGSQITGSASQPGAGINNVALSHVRGPNPVTPGPNDSFFDNPQGGNIQLNLSGVSDAVAAGFAKGKTYTVVITEDAPASG